MMLLKKAICSVLSLTIIATSLLSVAAEDKGDSLPASYSSVEQGYVTPVRNQGDTNTCWAHGSIAACESSMIINNGYDTTLDLSELHLSYAAYNKQYDKMGMFDGNQYNGNYIYAGYHIQNAIYALANQQGVVLETANHGQFSSTKLLYDKAEGFIVNNPESRYAYNEAYVTDTYEISTDNSDLVKEYIIKYGAGAVEFNAKDEFYNKETGAYYCCDDTDIVPTHVVAIVGWDDNYPKENCTVNGQTPNKDGAWLVKNSYGVEYGNDGYNWISYEDYSIGTYPVVFFKLAPADTYTNTYQYDDLCETVIYYDENYGAFFEGGAYMANVFTASKDNETLQAVSFYTSDMYLDYTIEIYTGVDDDTDPTSGTLKASCSGEDLLEGYHTIKLPNSVELVKGEKFSVVINIKDNQNTSREVKVEIDQAWLMSQRKITEYGESFFSKNGESFIDIKDNSSGNMRIKAFTNSDYIPYEPTDYYYSAEGKGREELLSELKSDIDKYALALESDYEFVFSYSLTDFVNDLIYAEQVCENNDLFLALDFYSMKNILEYHFETLSVYNFEENVKYFDTLPKWEGFANAYDSAIALAKTSHMENYEINALTREVNEAYADYMQDAVENGACNSYLQNFGDVDNNGEIDILDATAIQLILAKYNSFDFYSYYNSDVDGNGETDILDATAIQLYIARLLDYMPVYDKQVANENGIDRDTAISMLETAVENVESWYGFEDIESYLYQNEYMLLWKQYNDAKNVLNNADDYNPNVISFKAERLNSSIQAVE